MGKISNYELGLLKAYLELPPRKLLHSQFAMEEDYLAGFISRFIKGERFDITFTAFSKSELAIINPIISQNIQTIDGMDLLTSFLLTRIVCNIMNKYKKS